MPSNEPTRADQDAIIAKAPRALHVARDPRIAKGESVVRNACFVAGNSLWVIYGVCMSATAISVMCSINVLINGMILLATIRIRGDKRAEGS